MQSPSFQDLKIHAESLKEVSLKVLFEDKKRFDTFSLQKAGVFLDFSKQRITKQTLELLFDFLKESSFEKMRRGMFLGEKINFTENRSVLHVALRDFSERKVYMDGVCVSVAIKKVRKQMQEFSDAVRSGEYKGCTQKRIEKVIVLGIGGSCLGPKMVLTALEEYKNGPEIFFVANVDPQALWKRLEAVDPEKTLFIIASKTFTTQETMANANFARTWLLEAISKKLSNPPCNTEMIKKHFVALSSNSVACEKFGVAKENVFEFGDFIGGRFSLWSAIGLPIALGLGYEEGFLPLLKGAHAMDTHFETSRVEENLPVLLALLSFWENNFRGATQQLVLPYSQALRDFVPHLQQLSMESNGKSVDRTGSKVGYATAPVLWGESGTNGQHSFYQLLHQGTHAFAVDFIGVKTPGILKTTLLSSGLQKQVEMQHKILLSHLLAQSEALAFGRSVQDTLNEMTREGLQEEEKKLLLSHRSFAGNHPSNMLLLESITPESIGKLLALYEHKVFVEGCLLNLNSFDQWGVELGKMLAVKLLKEFEGEENYSHDISTMQLLNRLKNFEQ